MRPTLAVLLLAAALFLWNVWSYDLWAPDEPYFAEGAREMLVDGEWVVPHVNGVVTTDKPPLFFWLIALLSIPLGKVSEVTARLPSILAALGTVALTMRLGARMSDRRTAVLAGLVLCTTYMFWDKARSSQIDATLCLLIWVALSAFLSFRAGDVGGRRAGLLFWLAAALATLAKGPVGVLLPLAMALATLVADREIGRWRRFAPLAGPALFLAVTGAWIGLTIVAGPAEYSVWGAFREHFLERSIHGMHHPQPPWYFLQVLPGHLFPWIGLIAGAYLLAWKRRDAGDRFLMAASLVLLVIFSISTEKRGLYMLPAYPAFALLVARFALHILAAGPGREPPLSHRWLTGGQVAVGGGMVLGGLALPVVLRGEEEAPYWIVLGVAAIFLVAGAATLAAVWRGQRRAVLFAPAAGAVAGYLLVATALFPAMNPFKSGRPFALRIKEVTAASRAAGERVLAFNTGNLPETWSFYSDGVYTVETVDPERLIRHLERSGTVFALVNEANMDVLPAGLRGRVRVVDRTRLSRRDVLLLANR